MIKNLKSHVTGGKKVTSSENSAKTLGDIIKKKVYQIVTAASDGAVAALSIIKDLK